MSGPKLFVSYSWTTPDHEAWVLNLATDLRASGIDVILDKWDLREGHDAHAFMEKMVTDPEIKKVILICDKAYVDKTDGRTGGVGTEAQIISGRIYEKQAQDKFVAIVKERDEHGAAYLPAYYRSRIYIDLSDPGTFSENFEQLLRWAYDQPLYKKPELGKKPEFLSVEESATTLATSSRLKRALDAVRNNREHAIPATAEYFRLLSEEFEKLRINREADPFDEAVVQSIESFIRYRNEALEMFASLALYADRQESRVMLHRFFEQLIPYLDRPAHISQWHEWEWDNFRFIIHELFLYAAAVLIRHERFESAAYLMSTQYYLASESNYGRSPMVSFEVFMKYMPSLKYRNDRLQLRRLSLRADFLEQRCKGLEIHFRHLMQADFILFMRSCLSQQGRWWPETLVYSERHAGPFEVFARSRSASYFEQTKILLGVDSKQALQTLLQDLQTNPSAVPHWQYHSFSPSHLLGIDDLATQP